MAHSATDHVVMLCSRFCCRRLFVRQSKKEKEKTGPVSRNNSIKNKREGITLASIASEAGPAGAEEGAAADPAGPSVEARIRMTRLRVTTKPPAGSSGFSSSRHIADYRINYMVSLWVSGRGSKLSRLDCLFRGREGKRKKEESSAAGLRDVTCARNRYSPCPFYVCVFGRFFSSSSSLPVYDGKLRLGPL